MQLHEKYRPKTLQEVIGQESAIKRINLLVANGLSGRALWFAGASGTGKTTLARILADQVADPMYQTEIVGRPIEHYFRLVKDSRNNMRQVLTEIESGLML